MSLLYDQDKIYSLYDTAFNEFIKNMQNVRTYKNMLWWDIGQEPIYWAITP